MLKSWSLAICCCCALTSFSDLSFADDIMVFEAGNRALFSGTIVRERFDDIVVETNGDEIQVELNSINLKDQQKNMIRRGMRVLVAGPLKSNGREMRAERIMFLTSRSLEEKIEAEIISNSMF